MPSHVTNVYNDIDDGMLLLSLSLNERSNDRRGLEIEEVYDSSFDDPMDIDDTGELSNHMDIDDTTFEIDHVASDNYANKEKTTMILITKKNVGKMGCFLYYLLR